MTLRALHPVCLLITAQALTNLGLQPYANSPDEFRALIRSETDKWGKVVKAADIKGD